MSALRKLRRAREKKKDEARELEEPEPDSDSGAVSPPNNIFVALEQHRHAASDHESASGSEEEGIIVPVEAPSKEKAVKKKKKKQKKRTDRTANSDRQQPDDYPSFDAESKGSAAEIKGSSAELLRMQKGLFNPDSEIKRVFGSGVLRMTREDSRRERGGGGVRRSGGRARSLRRLVLSCENPDAPLLAERSLALHVTGCRTGQKFFEFNLCPESQVCLKWLLHLRFLH